MHKNSKTCIEIANLACFFLIKIQNKDHLSGESIPKEVFQIQS